jgi:hypothetical protein
MGKLIAPQSDPYFNNVELLLSMNGANGSTTFLDSSKNNSAITINGNPQISTAQSKYGGSSAYFNGNESYLDVFNLPSDYLSQDFTIEAWVWVDDSKINSNLFNTFPHNSFGVSLNRENIGGRTSFAVGDGVNWYAGIESDTPLSFNTWQHIALVRSNNTITLYENGIARASTNYVPIGFSTSCRIGSITWEGGLNSEEYLGYMDDFRITKGIARYTSNFVPQNKEFYDGKIIKNISIKKQNLGSGKIISNENYILNSQFNADNQYERSAYDNNYFFNGNCSDSDACNILTNYKHNSPLFYEPSNNSYRTFSNRTFHDINSPYDILPIDHPIQPRLIKMFGVGSKFPTAWSSNLTNYLKTITNTTSFSPSDSQSWTKYGVEQMVIIPSWATKVVYGVKYLAKSDDLFRDNNFAGLKLNFRLSNFITQNRNYVNIHLIRKSYASAVDTLESLYGSNVYLYFNADSSSNAMCQWLGPNVTKVKVRKRSSTIIDSNTNQFIKIKDTIDIPTFSSSSAEPDSGNGRPESVSLEMFFAEWVSYLNNDAISSGSIYFYEPFIYFV